jgi:serine-type D-Ala-D-Ala carboxypeptidase (penicillin-binding protein 5/6)
MQKYLTIIFIFILSFYARAEALETKAKQAILVDAITGEVLFEKNGYTKMPTSSMSKIMTAYVIFDNLKKGKINLDTKFITSENAWRTGGSRMFIPLGEEVNVELLLRGLIIQSGNDAAVTLAEGLLGSEASFAEKMNEYSKALNMNNSHFMNSTGLPDENHYSTSYDLALLAKSTIEDFPEYYGYYSEKEMTYNNITQPNRNMSLSRNIGCDGLKTGHTEDGGYGIVSSAVQGNRRLIAVVNGLNSEKERNIESEQLLKYGFLNYTNLVIAKKGQLIEQASLYGNNEDKIGLVTHEDIILTLPNGLESKVTANIEYNSPVFAPVDKNQEVGVLIVNIDKDKQRIYKIYPDRDVSKPPLYRKILANIKYIF